MKDLANLYYFEKLLEDVNNDLVRQAQAKGDIAIGAVCFQIPEPLINLPGSFSVRLRAPRTGSIEMGTYYMSSMLCEGCRAILERAIEGGFNFLDCIIAPDACAQMNRCVENIERQHLIEKEKFFVEYSDVPMKNDETALRHFVKQMRLHVLEELKTREPDKKCNYRARVVMVGSEIDNPELIKLAEEAGALVVADRFCFGSLPGRDEIILNDTEDVLTQICRQYMEWGQCPRFMNTEKIIERQEYVDAIAKEYKADGLIYEQIKFCDYWGYERASAFHVMKEKYGYPVLSIDRPYAVGTSGQLRTRIQAFVESLEIKRINAGRKL